METPSREVGARFWIALAAIFSLPVLPALAWIFVSLCVLEDWIRALGNPPRHERVRFLEAPAALPKCHELARGDFDGDGVDDLLEREYLHREPLFSRTTSAMLYVRSGADGSLLLAHPISTPFSEGWWCGDVDGDGLDDVVADSEGGPVVLAFRPR